MGRLDISMRCMEIRRLLDAGELEQAFEMAEDLDIERVNSIVDLKVIASVYERMGHYEDAMEVLQRSYEKKPTKMAVYRLAYLCVKTGNFDDAEFFYREFADMAPNSPDKYILRYGIDRAKGVDYYIRIATLQELKAIDYREEWGYELAKVYHKAGLYEDCVRECDDLILWFGEGVIVEKAKLLKKYHTEGKASLDAYGVFDKNLTPKQVEKNREKFRFDTQDLGRQIRELAETEEEYQLRGDLERDLEKTVDLRKAMIEDTEALDLLGREVHRSWGSSAPAQGEEVIQIKKLRNKSSQNSFWKRKKTAPDMEEIYGEEEEDKIPSEEDWEIRESVAVKPKFHAAQLQKELAEEIARFEEEDSAENYESDPYQDMPVYEEPGYEESYQGMSGYEEPGYEESYQGMPGYEESRYEEDYRNMPMYEEPEYVEDSQELPVHEESRYEENLQNMSVNEEPNYEEKTMSEEPEYEEESIAEDYKYEEELIEEKFEYEEKMAAEKFENEAAFIEEKSEYKEELENEEVPIEEEPEYEEEPENEEIPVEEESEYEEEPENEEVPVEEESEYKEKPEYKEEPVEEESEYEEELENKEALVEESKYEEEPEQEIQAYIHRDRKQSNTGIFSELEEKTEPVTGEQRTMSIFRKLLGGFKNQKQEEENEEIRELNKKIQENNNFKAVTESESVTKIVAVKKNAEPVKESAQLENARVNVVKVKPATEKENKKTQKLQVFTKNKKQEETVTPVVVKRYMGKKTDSVIKEAEEKEETIQNSQPNTQSTQKNTDLTSKEDMTESSVTMDDVWSLFPQYWEDTQICEGLLSLLHGIFDGNGFRNLIITSKSPDMAKELCGDIAEVLQGYGVIEKDRVISLAAEKLNKMHLEQNYEKVKGSILQITCAGKITADTAQSIMNMVEELGNDVIVVLNDQKPYMDDFMNQYKIMGRYFPYWINL